MSLEPFTKQPSESYPIGFEYYGRTPFGALPVTATASAHNITDNVAANAVLQSTTGLIQGTTVLVGVQGGVSGKSYKITVQTRLSDGSVLESERTMVVAET